MPAHRVARPVGARRVASGVLQHVLDRNIEQPCQVTNLVGDSIRWDNPERILHPIRG